MLCSEIQDSSLPLLPTRQDINGNVYSQSFEEIVRRAYLGNTVQLYTFRSIAQTASRAAFTVAERLYPQE
jgi:hypothetical protein